MTIHIPLDNLSPKIKKLYLEDKIKGLGFDYHPNAIIGYINSKEGYKEIEVFNLSRICKLDNRFSSYNIFKNKTEIILEIVVQLK